MSDKDTSPLLPPPNADPSQSHSEDMTNHIDQVTSTTEHVNGGGEKPGIDELGKQNSSESIDPKPKLGRQDSSESIDPKPKSTFKITSVTLHPQKGSSQDGRHSFGEDDDESAVDDSSVQTDMEESPAPSNHLSEMVKQQQHQQTQYHRQDRVDSTSRFKVVKIQKRKPYNVGRWRISDFMSESVLNSNKATPEVNHTVKHSSESGNSSRASSTHYVHGVDDPSKNPLASINTFSNQVLTSIQQSPQAQTGLLSAGIELSNGSGINDRLHQLSDAAVTGGGLSAGNLAAAASSQINNDPILDSTTNSGIGGNGGPITSSTSTKVLPHDSHSNAVTGLAVVNSQPTVQTGISRGGQPSAGQITNQLQQPQQKQATVAGDQSSTVQQGPSQVVSRTAAHTSVGVAGAGIAPSTSSGSSTDGQSATNLDNAVTVKSQTAAATEDVQTVVDVPARDRSIVASVPGTPLELSSGGVEALAANLTELVDPSPTVDGDRAEDADAAATGVAIDNKIEQAMDLVKSHLMLAVREEVEDLKQQIKQLLERNNHLEQENQLLRSSAAPETIAQLAVLSRQQNH